MQKQQKNPPKAKYCIKTCFLEAVDILGPFIRGKIIRRELDHLYENVLSKSSVYLNLLLKCKFIIRR